MHCTSIWLPRYYLCLSSLGGLLLYGLAKKFVLTTRANFSVNPVLGHSFHYWPTLLSKQFVFPNFKQVAFLGLPFTTFTDVLWKKSESEVSQSCLTLCDPMDCSLPGYSVCGIFQARLLESEGEREVAQSCPTLCHPLDCSLSGSSVHGILQARILEWVAVSFSRSSQPRDWTQVSCIVSRCFTI